MAVPYEAGGVPVTLFPWQVTVDGRLLPMVGHIDADDAAEARAIVEHDCELAFPGSKVTVHVRPVVPLLQQVEDSGTHGHVSRDPQC